MADLNQLRVAVLITDGVEESELTVPAQALLDSGAKITIVSPSAGKVQSFQHTKKSKKYESNCTLKEANPGDYDAVLLPGGVINADKLRMVKEAQEFIKTINDAAKPIAVICHGPWLLVSAGLVKNRKLTSYYTLQDDIKNADGNWVDEEVVVSGNWVSSRSPADLPAFCREMMKLFSQSPSEAIIQIAESA